MQEKAATEAAKVQEKATQSAKMQEKAAMDQAAAQEEALLRNNALSLLLAAAQRGQ
jgi:hypothetical protein